MTEMTAAGGVVYKNDSKETHVLLIKRWGVWDLPKGKQEEAESLETCAAREVSEEVGCERPEIKGRLIRTYHTYESNGEKIGKTTYWFAMSTDTEQDFTPQIAEDIEKVEWHTLDDAKEMVGYENLKEVLEVFEHWHQQHA